MLLAAVWTVWIKSGCLAQKTYLACFSTWAAEAMQLFLPTLEGMVVPVSDTSRWTKACDTGTEWDRPWEKVWFTCAFEVQDVCFALPSSKLFFYVHCSLCLSDWHTQTFIRCHKMPQCHSMSYHVILVPCHTCTYLLVNQQICISAPFNHFPSLFGMAMMAHRQLASDGNHWGLERLLPDMLALVKCISDTCLQRENSWYFSTYTT